MEVLQLIIGNHNYSPWSMRPWLLLKAFDIPFDAVFLRLDAQLPEHLRQIGKPSLAPSKVPLLRDDDIWIWDSLAIAEYLAEKFPAKNLWPQDAAQRALARSLCAEMHSGFGDLRTHCGMNIEADLATIGQKMYAEDSTRGAALRADVARLNQIFSLTTQHGSTYLFGDFSIADAYFAPALLRLQTYGLPLSTEAAAYRDRLIAHPAVVEWVADARNEADFLPAYEPYRGSR